MLEGLRARIRKLFAAPPTAAQRAAVRIQAKLRADATTQRGNVPGYGAMGGPITATANGASVDVNGPDWVMRKARDLGQPAEWAAIVRDELAAELRR